MNHIVFHALAVANQFAAAIDAELGYPKDGVNVGGGIHAPAVQSRTLRHASPVKHPSKNEWSYPDDAIVESKRGRVPLPPTATSKVLEPDWTPPGQV